MEGCNSKKFKGHCGLAIFAAHAVLHVCDWSCTRLTDAKGMYTQITVADAVLGNLNALFPSQM